MNIITNGHLYFPKFAAELTAAQRHTWEGLLDVSDESEEEFIVYRDDAYLLSDCMRMTQKELRAAGWDGYQDDTYFSLVVCKYDDETGGYKMGLAFS